MNGLDGWAHVSAGKVRDIYAPLGSHAYGTGEVILVVTSDRISAFDHVLPTEIPDKGKILNQLSLWWFHQLRDIVPNHVVSLDVPEQVEGRAMICRRLSMVPIECVARGHLAGSGVVEYNSTGTVCGVPLPPNLRTGDRLENPIFTPAYKAEMGEHDENISFERAAGIVGSGQAAELRRLTLDIFSHARDIAAERGLILADTKFEFGEPVDSLSSHKLVLADEVLTPDSSRYWATDLWKPGKEQHSFDKQFLRNWLLSSESGWNRASDTAPPPLPDDIVEKTRERYLEVFRRLTGTEPNL